MLRDTLDLGSPSNKSADGILPAGRLHITAQPRLWKLAGRDGLPVQFLLMPYPTARHYLRDSEAKYANVQSQFKNAMEQYKERIDPSLPAVLVSHIHVRGAQTHTLYKVSEVEDVIFEPTDIPAAWAYVAYGHIHKPQSAVPGAPHIRYCGSVEKLDFAERDDQKSVVVADIGRSGLIGEPQILPLQTSPILELDIAEPEIEIPALAAKYKDDAQAKEALIKYKLRWQPGKHNRDALCKEIDAIFPRWYAREVVELGRDDIAVIYKSRRLDDVVGTVREYLGQQLNSHTQGKEVLAMAESILVEFAGAKPDDDSPNGTPENGAKHREKKPADPPAPELFADTAAPLEQAEPAPLQEATVSNEG
jgi:DNA repair exonuclease SbcCD nuclease subunit